MTHSEISAYITAVKNGHLDPKKYISELIAKLSEENKKLNVFSNLSKKPDSHSDGPLSGLPFTVKDNICVKGSPTRAGSKILEGYLPPFDATVVEKMKAAGAVFIGTTNMDEFGFGTFSTNCGFGIPKNPFDASRSCGGSSGELQAQLRS